MNHFSHAILKFLVEVPSISKMFLTVIKIVNLQRMTETLKYTLKINRTQKSRIFARIFNASYKNQSNTN
jgi:hypothetical protein